VPLIFVTTYLYGSGLVGQKLSWLSIWLIFYERLSTSHWCNSKLVLRKERQQMHFFYRILCGVLLGASKICSGSDGETRRQRTSLIDERFPLWVCTLRLKLFSALNV